MAVAISDYPKVLAIDVAGNGGRLRKAVDFDSFVRDNWLIWNAINGLLGRGKGGLVLQGPLNMGGFKISGGSNNGSPTNDEFLTFGAAQSFYGAKALLRHLQMGGDAQLNVQGLHGLLADPQPMGVALVLSLPNPYNPAIDPVQSPTELVVSFSNSLWRLDKTKLPFVFRVLTTTGIIPSGLRSAMPAAGTAGVPYFQTDTGWLYLDNGVNYVYAWGIDVGTDAVRAALTIGVNDNGALFITSDTRILWRVQAGAWANILSFAPTFYDNELPTGLISGLNKTFTLVASPNPAASLQLFLNGVLQQQGAGKDYTLVGLTITMVNAPQIGDILIAYYRA